jgi:hypothetical protein
MPQFPFKAPRTVALATLLVAACDQPPAGDPSAVRADDPVGVCSVGEAFEPTVTGLTNYVTNSRHLAFLLTCITPGSTGTMVTIALPGVPALPDTGTYVVRLVAAAPARPRRTAWAEVHLSVGTPAPAHYVASGGQLRVRSSAKGVVQGSYELALDRAPEADTRYPAQLAIRGSFVAPRMRDES